LRRINQDIKSIVCFANAYDVLCWACVVIKIIVFLKNTRSIMRHSTFIDLIYIHGQKTSHIVRLRRVIVLWLNIHVMWQRCFSLRKTLMMLLVCIVLSFARLAWLFYLNIRHVMLIIVELQNLFMLSRNKDNYMKFDLFHVRQRLYIFNLVFNALFSKNSSLKRLIQIKMSLVDKINVLSKILINIIFVLFFVNHSQLFVFIIDRS
jgi:hypothetical protein